MELPNHVLEALIKRLDQHPALDRPVSLELKTDSAPSPTSRLIVQNGAFAGAAPLSIGDASKLLNSVATSVMTARIARMGESESGAYNFYRARISRGTAVADYEIKLAQLIQQMPNFSHYHEVGSGIGTLPILLALSGYSASGIEFDVRRQAAACELYDSVCLQRPELAARCELVAGRFPDAVANKPVGQSLAIVTNLVATTSDELVNSILSGFRRYAAVLFDIDRFIEKRDTDEQRAHILTKFSDAGLKNPVRILDLGDAGRYYVVVNSV